MSHERTNGLVVMAFILCEEKGPKENKMQKGTGAQKTIIGVHQVSTTIG